MPTPTTSVPRSSPPPRPPPSPPSENATRPPCPSRTHSNKRWRRSTTSCTSCAAVWTRSGSTDTPQRQSVRRSAPNGVDRGWSPWPAPATPNSVAVGGGERLRPHRELDAVDGRAAEAEHWADPGGDGGGEVEGRRRRLAESGELLGREGDLQRGGIGGQLFDRAGSDERGGDRGGGAYPG